MLQGKITSGVSPWVIGIVAGLGLVIAVNLAMMLLAIRSSRGEIENNPYARGMAFEETIRQRRYVDEQGWQVFPEFRLGEKGIASLQIEMRIGQAPVPALVMSAELRRPSDRRYDRSCHLNEQSQGAYQCIFEGLPSGLYLLTLFIGDDGRVDREVILK